MPYLAVLLFLQGIIAFISPCMLPMLPLYISYFAGGAGGKGRALKNSLGFMLGFSAVFTLMGAFASAAGHFLRQYETALGIITGAIIIIFGLYFLGFIKFSFGGKKATGIDLGNLGFLSSLLFGIVFSVSFTPCIGVHLAIALSMAAVEGTMFGGVLLLICFSLGLGVPFVLSALLLDRLKTAFDWIKRHYSAVTKVSGGLLIAIGILMMTGLMWRFVALLEH